MQEARFPGVVRPTAALPEHGLSAGELGGVIEELGSPAEADDVEFSDDDGHVVAWATLEPDQVEEAIAGGVRVPQEASA